MFRDGSSNTFQIIVRRPPDIGPRAIVRGIGPQGRTLRREPDVTAHNERVRWQLGEVS